MELVSSFTQGNRTAKIYSDFSGYTVEYFINEKVIKKTHHVAMNLAEDIADDFVSEAGSNPSLLNE